VGGIAMAKGTAVAIAVVTGTAIVGAPLIVMALGFGVVIGVLYNTTDLQNSVEQQAKKLFGVK
jgi:flagellar biosynthesis protein FliQ